MTPKIPPPRPISAQYPTRYEAAPARTPEQSRQAILRGHARSVDAQRSAAAARRLPFLTTRPPDGK